MAVYPTHVRVQLQRDTKSGLFAAVSDDLPGLMTVASTIEEVERRLPAAIAQLVEAQYGALVRVNVEPTEHEDRFASLAEPRVVELHAA
jgi:predicted RNase H-like HicB family nuclease